MRSHLDRINDWEARVRGAKYRVANLARNVKITSRQLERYFLSTFNCHPKQWIQKIRRKDAWRLKREGLLDKEIAQRLGFKQPSHFSRLFGKPRNAVQTKVKRVEQTRQPAKCRKKILNVVKTHFILLAGQAVSVIIP
jgi:AraC-like DNA-binding protein